MDVFAAAHRSTVVAAEDHVFARAHASTTAPPAAATTSSELQLRAPVGHQLPLPLRQPSAPETAAPSPAPRRLSSVAPLLTSTHQQPGTSDGIHQSRAPATTRSLRVDAIQSHAAEAIARARAHLSTPGPQPSPSCDAHSSASLNETIQRGRDVLARAESRARQAQRQSTDHFDFDAMSDVSVDLQRGLVDMQQGGADLWAVDVSAVAPTATEMPPTPLVSLA